MAFLAVLAGKPRMAASLPRSAGPANPAIPLNSTRHLLLFAQVDATRAQDANSAAYVVSYIDVSKPAVARVADILRQMAQASRQASGTASYDVLQHLAPQNQFVIVQVWKNQQAPH
jgi:hypothetical protein